MYRLTGEAKYDALYRQLRQEHSYEAAFVYATLPGGMGDGETRQACVHTILQAAERALAFGEKAPYHTLPPPIRRSPPPAPSALSILSPR